MPRIHIKSLKKGHVILHFNSPLVVSKVKAISKDEFHVYVVGSSQPLVFPKNHYFLLK
jgi:hypothetical protein